MRVSLLLLFVTLSVSVVSTHSLRYPNGNVWREQNSPIPEKKNIIYIENMDVVVCFNPHLGDTEQLTIYTMSQQWCMYTSFQGIVLSLTDSVFRLLPMFLHTRFLALMFTGIALIVYAIIVSITFVIQVLLILSLLTLCLAFLAMVCFGEKRVHTDANKSSKSSS